MGTNMFSIFQNIYEFNGDISSWNTSSVKIMEFMFRSANAFNGDLGNWNTSSVTTMKSMFQYAEAFNSDISAWDISSVTIMENMFNSVASFGLELCWDIDASTDNMFGYSNDGCIKDSTCCPNCDKNILC